jgi:hypothetical protein
MKAKSALCWNMLTAVIGYFTICILAGFLTTRLMMTKTCADALHSYRPHHLPLHLRVTRKA